MIGKITSEVKKLHDDSSDECQRVWFFENHVLFVATYAKKIAEKNGGDPEVAYLAGLLHDIAYNWNVFEEPQLSNESKMKASELMKKCGYSREKISLVLEIINGHNCRNGIPESPEGKAMVTADGLAHF